MPNLTSICKNRSSQNSWKHSYRSDIDGLRAIAVGSVFIFHLNPAWMPGGFVGVDVFFVMSGYLITTILMRDLQNGGIGLAKVLSTTDSSAVPRNADRGRCGFDWGVAVLHSAGPRFGRD